MQHESQHSAQERTSVEYNPSDIPFDMYHVPGHGTVQDVRRAFERYRRSQRWDQEISQLADATHCNAHAIKKVLETGHEKQKIYAMSLVPRVREDERITLIRQGLQDKNESVQVAAVKVISTLPHKQRTEIIQYAIEHGSLGVQLEATQGILLAPSTDRVSLRERTRSLVDNVFTNMADLETRIQALPMIWSISEYDRDAYRDHIAEPLIREALAREDVDVACMAIKKINYIPESLKRMEVLFVALAKKEPRIKCAAINATPHLFLEEQKVTFLQEALKEPQEEVKACAIQAVTYLHASLTQRNILKELAGQEQALSCRVMLLNRMMELPHTHRIWIQDFIDQIFSSVFTESAKDIKFNLMANIRYVSERTKNELITQAMHNEDIEIQLAAIAILTPSLYATETLINEVSDIILQALEENNFSITYAAIRAIGSLPEIRQALHYERAFVKIKEHIASEKHNFADLYLGDCIALLPRVYKHDLIAHIFSKNFGSHLIEPPLYKNNEDMGEKSFERRAFDKRGSETTLLGGSLKGKTIIRHILPEAFFAWKKAYESFTTWRALGFSYVPVEPIQKYHPGEREVVDVYSGVLDVDLMTWLRISDNMFHDELEKQRIGIIEGLKQLHIEHGHPHKQNFVLRFHRDANGNPMLNPPPRLYVIDFDAAKRDILYIDNREA